MPYIVAMEKFADDGGNACRAALGTVITCLTFRCSKAERLATKDSLTGSSRHFNVMWSAESVIHHETWTFRQRTRRIVARRELRLIRRVQSRIRWSVDG
jgi:hypothetical protein